MAYAQRGVLLVAVLCLVGCGGPSTTAKRRSAVNAYFGRVSQAEVPLTSRIGQIDQAFQAFSFKNTGADELRALVSARTAIRAGLRRVAAIRPPPDARAVHDDLVRVLTLQAAVADELVQSVLFVPRFATTNAPLVAAATKLGRGLAAVKAPTPTVAQTGAQLWNAGGCGGCHTLAASGSNGKSGPNLDHLRPSRDAVAAQVRTGSPKMPAYGKALTAAQIDAIAVYVSAAAGHPSAGPGGRTTAPPNAAPDVYVQYAAVFARYRAAMAPILAGLEQLVAPAELRPILLAERRVLARSSSLCTEIEHDLGKHDVASANKAIQQLFEVASGVNAPEVSNQQAAAARAYDARLATIARLSAKLVRERQRLQTELQ